VVACSLLRLYENPVSPGVTGYPSAFDQLICVTDPPAPDHLGAAEAKAAQ
jgi:hypothetical protein